MTDPLPRPASLALVEATQTLRAAGIEGASADARKLMAYALDVPPSRLTLVLPDPMSDQAEARLSRAVAARATRQPVSQILGHRLFFGRDLRVTPDVLDPRPETETLVLAVMSLPFATVLDMGTGSGAILISLLAERPGTTGLGTDLSPRALDVARGNAAQFGVGERARWACGDWWGAVSGQFDLIVSNPPYIALDEMPGLAPEVRDHEPHMALTDGADGLSVYRILAHGAQAHLTPGGTLAVEIGPTQATAVVAMFALADLRDIRTLRDMDGRPRVVLGQRPVSKGNEAP